MSKDLSIYVKFQKELPSVWHLICCFEKIGWNCYDKEGNISFFDSASGEDYDWKCIHFGESAREQLIQSSCNKNGVIGVILYYMDTGIGVSMLVSSLEEIQLICNINRVTVPNNSAITDFAWYFNKIIIPMGNIDLVFDQIEFCADNY